MITRRGGNTTWTMSLLSTLVFDFGFARNRAFSAFPTHKNYGYWDVPATHWWAWWANWPQHCHSPGVRKASQKSILSAFSNRIHAGRLGVWLAFAGSRQPKQESIWWYPKVSQVRSNFLILNQGRPWVRGIWIEVLRWISWVRRAVKAGWIAALGGVGTLASCWTSWGPDGFLRLTKGRQRGV